MTEQDRDDHTSQAALLGAIDERTRLFADSLKDLAASLRALRADVVTRAEFDAKLRPLQMAVYGFVALVVTGVIGALMAQVLR